MEDLVLARLVSSMYELICFQVRFGHGRWRCRWVSDCAVLSNRSRAQYFYMWSEVSRFKFQSFPFSFCPTLYHLTWYSKKTSISRTLEVVDDWGAEHQPNPSKWLPAMNPNLKEVGNPSHNTKYVKAYQQSMVRLLRNRQLWGRNLSFVLWGEECGMIAIWC